MSCAKKKLVSSCLGIIYLAPIISNPAGAKLSCWHLGINYFGANWDQRKIVHSMEFVSLARNYPAGAAKEV